MHRDWSPSRPLGTGSLLKHRHRSGAETWYGKWRSGGRQVMRVLGPVRLPPAFEGLTRQQAEAALEAAISAEAAAPSDDDVIDVAEAGRRYITNRETIGLKPGTPGDYESYLRVHLVPFFGSPALDEIDSALAEDFIARKREQGLAIKSVRTISGSSKRSSRSASAEAGARRIPSQRSSSRAIDANPTFATSASPSSTRS